MLNMIGKRKLKEAGTGRVTVLCYDSGEGCWDLLLS